MTALTFSRRALLGAGAALAMPSIGRAAATGEVVLTSFFGIFEDVYTKAVVAPFNAANPTIKVSYRATRGSAEMTAMLRTGRSRPTVDVMIMDLAIAAQNAREGLIGAIDPAQVPNMADVFPWGRTEGNMGVAVTQDVLSLLYAPGKVKKAPTSWLDLADPSFAGRLGMPIGDVRGTVMLALLTRLAGGDYKKDVAPGLATMKRICANTQTYEPQPDIYTSIRSGVVDAGVGWNARGQLNADQSKGEFMAIVPMEGTAPQVNTINLVAKGPNPEAAQVFINYALSVEAQTAFAQALYYGPTNSKVQLDPALNARIFGSAESRAKQMELDFDWFSRNSNALITRIRREVMAG